MKARARSKLNLTLAGFWERQKARAAAREEQQREYAKRGYAQQALPIHRIIRRPPDPPCLRDLYPDKTAHQYTNFRPLHKSAAGGAS
jgi:hypothetical protein